MARGWSNVLRGGRRTRFRGLELSIDNRKLPRDFVNVGFRDWRVKGLERLVLYQREWTPLQRCEADLRPPKVTEVAVRSRRQSESFGASAPVRLVRRTIVTTPTGTTRRCRVAERVDAAAGADDPRGEGRAARQPVGRQRHGTTGEEPDPSRTTTSTSRRCRTSSPRPARVPLEEASRHGLGHLTRVYGSIPLTVAEGAAELVRQQRIVLTDSRLGIPALVHEECLTGFTTYGATVYPAAIAWGATFDPDLIERMAAAIGRDMAAVGVHQGLSPVLDVVRDYRWGRVEETMGEDPYLVVDARRRVRPGAAERRGDRHPQALRRVLRLPRRPQPRPGADGPARADGRDPA